MSRDHSEKAFEKLTAIASSMQRQNTLEDLLWEIAEKTSEVLGLEDCVIYLAEADGLAQHAAYGIKRAGGRNLRNRMVVPYGEGVVGTVAACARPERIADVRSDPRYIEDEFHGRSELSVPILSAGRVAGVLDSECSQPNGYSPHDEALFAAVATLAGPQIDRVLAQRKLEQGPRTQTRPEDSPTAPSATARTVHDLNNLLTIIAGNAAVARLNPAPQALDESLTEIEEATERASVLTRRILKATAAAAAPLAAPASTEASGRILVLEDEPSVLRMLSRSLRQAGYEVVVAAQPADSRFDLVILDIADSSRTAGVKRVRELRELDPEMPVIVTSVNGRRPELQNPARYGFQAALIKPFTLLRLQSVVAEALRKRAEHRPDPTPP